MDQLQVLQNKAAKTLPTYPHPDWSPQQITLAFIYLASPIITQSKQHVHPTISVQPQNAKTSTQRTWLRN
jgi:hypothetical protein